MFTYEQFDTKTPFYTEAKGQKWPLTLQAKQAEKRTCVTTSHYLVIQDHIDGNGGSDNSFFADKKIITANEVGSTQ